VTFATPEPREVAPGRAGFPRIGHVARPGHRSDFVQTQRSADLCATGLWHPHCVLLARDRTEEGTAMARIMGALITIIFVAVTLLGWVTMRM